MCLNRTRIFVEKLYFLIVFVSYIFYYFACAWALRICVKMLDSSSRFLLARICVPKRRFKNFSALLSFETFNNSIALFSYGACPQTSRIRSRTNLECFVCLPFNLDGLILPALFLPDGIFVVLCPFSRPTAISYLGAIT